MKSLTFLLKIFKIYKKSHFLYNPNFDYIFIKYNFKSLLFKRLNYYTRIVIINHLILI